jgi:hypothetical protein
MPAYLQEANPKAASRRRADKGGNADCVADQYPEAEVNFRDRPNFLCLQWVNDAALVIRASRF